MWKDKIILLVMSSLNACIITSPKDLHAVNDCSTVLAHVILYTMSSLLLLRLIIDVGEYSDINDNILLHGNPNSCIVDRW